jgi:hypothetical protein
VRFTRLVSTALTLRTIEMGQARARYRVCSDVRRYLAAAWSRVVAQMTMCCRPRAFCPLSVRLQRPRPPCEQQSPRCFARDRAARQQYPGFSAADLIAGCNRKRRAGAAWR